MLVAPTPPPVAAGGLRCCLLTPLQCSNRMGRCRRNNLGGDGPSLSTQSRCTNMARWRSSYALTCRGWTSTFSTPVWCRSILYNAGKLSQLGSSAVRTKTSKNYLDVLTSACGVITGIPSILRPWPDRRDVERIPLLGAPSSSSVPLPSSRDIPS